MKKYELRPVAENERCLLWSHDSLDEKTGCIGHLRADFGSGEQFYSTWWEHQDALKTDSFRKEFDCVINYFRFESESKLLQGLKSMAKLCSGNDPITSDGRSFGFKVVTDDFSYYLRCTPMRGDYNLYCYCYDNSRLLPYLEAM